jgi:hypothetical protein
MTRFYINANKTLVSNGQVKIRVDSNAQSTTTTTTTTTTTAPGPLFSSVRWAYNPDNCSYTASGNTITISLPALPTSPYLDFAIPNATFTAAKITSGGPDGSYYQYLWYGKLLSQSNFPGASLDKNGSYEKELVYNASSGSVANMPAGNYTIYIYNYSGYSGTITLVLS